VGAALGYLSGKQVVNNYHRYAELVDPKKQNKKDISVKSNTQTGISNPDLFTDFKL
jgi:hypothetical protein